MIEMFISRPEIFLTVSAAAVFGIGILIGIKKCVYKDEDEIFF